MMALTSSVPPQSLTVIRDFADLFDLLRDPDKVKALLGELDDALSRAHDAAAVADERIKQAEAATAALAEAQTKAETDGRGAGGGARPADVRHAQDRRHR